jgi:hypothetical protein
MPTGTRVISDSKIETSTRRISSPGVLVKSGGKEPIELTRNELDMTTGGTAGGDSAKDPISIHHF